MQAPRYRDARRPARRGGLLAGAGRSTSQQDPHRERRVPPFRAQASAGIQLEATLLIRTRETTSQTGLTRAQRRANLRGAFAVQRPEKLRGRRILLVDDVMTTGSTASECARVLLRGGAKEVFVATVARATREVPSVLSQVMAASAARGGTLGHA